MFGYEETGASQATLACGGERGLVLRAVSHSIKTIGPPQSGQIHVSPPGKERSNSESHAALVRVAAKHPDLVSVTPKFEATSCPAKIDGIHLHEQNGPALGAAAITLAAV